jgi:starch-binding outer membrane protein, SusD/RagB family
MNILEFSGRARRSRRAAAAPLSLMAALALPLAGCSLDSVLEISDPDVTTQERIQDPSNVGALQSGALADFMVAYGGNTLGGGATEGIVLTSGLLGDELYVSDTFGTRREVDMRMITPENANLTTVFRNLHRARRAAEVASDMFMEHSPNTSGHAEVTSLAGYTYTMFAENYCSGVPFSQLSETNQLEHGDSWTTQQMYDEALSRFTAAAAIADAAGNSTQRNLALVGSGRVLLDMGRFEDAAAAVATVPTSFSYELEFSENTSRQNNGIWGLTHNRRGYGVAHEEGGNGLPFRQGNSQDPASQDPRVPYTRTNAAAIDAPYAHFWQLKYPERGSAVPLATGIEARLIEAEAALRRTDLITFVAKHNELRALEPGLAPVSLIDVTAMSQSQRVDLHFQERAFWLYLTAQRLSDMRRLIRQYDRPVESVFPTGPYGRPLHPQGGTAVPDANIEFRFQGSYGPDVNLPVPFDEQNNPNFDGCFDRNA